ncbi:unnamed protein product [Linum trigynum]|uniref:Uncharacterized protein n=1 Tax=Linum trigynum TaxID=586398 RepID=A0AAV2F932_9ROSI
MIAKKKPRARRETNPSGDRQGPSGSNRVTGPKNSNMGSRFTVLDVEEDGDSHAATSGAAGSRDRRLDSQGRDTKREVGNRGPHKNADNSKAVKQGTKHVREVEGQKTTGSPHPVEQSLEPNLALNNKGVIWPNKEAQTKDMAPEGNFEMAHTRDDLDREQHAKPPDISARLPPNTARDVEASISRNYGIVNEKISESHPGLLPSEDSLVNA